MFTENKIIRIFEIVKNIKDEEYVIWNKAILIDETGKPLKNLRQKHISNNSSIVINIKNKNKLVEYLKKIYMVVDLGLLCYFNKKIIKLDEALTYFRKHEGNLTGGKFDRKILEMDLHDHQYIYEMTKCRNQLDKIINYKIQLNIIYNANYRISLKEYIEDLFIFDKNYAKRLLKIILYKFFRSYLKKYYLRKYIYVDLNL
jgi:hypothetical protein